MFDWLFENWSTLLVGASGVVAGASVALHVIAPLTKSKTDDKIAKWIRPLEFLLKKLSLHKPG